MSIPSSSFHADPLEVSDIFVEPSPIFYSKVDFITTKQGNKISRQCVLKGSDKITVAGKVRIHVPLLLCRNL
jgi:hypothetical protein